MLASALLAVGLSTPATPTRAAPSAATGALLTAIEPLGFAGFDASPTQRQEIQQLINSLQQLNPNPSPANDLDGDWQLIYSDAPDITSLRNSGPLVRLQRVGQQIDAAAKTIANVIEYKPRMWLPLSTFGAEDDRIQQRVLLTYSVDDEGRRCKLSIDGASLAARKFLGVSLDAAPPLTIRGITSLPFGEFVCLYNDGDVRIAQTQQGYYSVNRRLDASSSEGWGAMA